MGTEKYKTLVQLVIRDESKARNLRNATILQDELKSWTPTVGGNIWSLTTDIIDNNPDSACSQALDVLGQDHIAGHWDQRVRRDLRIIRMREVPMTTINLTHDNMAAMANLGLNFQALLLPYDEDHSSALLFDPDDSVRTHPEEIWADIVFTSPGVDVAKITEVLQLQPLSCHRAGDLLLGNPNRIYPTNFWSVGVREHSCPIEIPIHRLCEIWDEKRAAIEELCLLTNAAIWITIFLDGEDCEIGFAELSNETLSMMASTSCDLSLSINIGFED